MDLKYICIILCILVLPVAGQNSSETESGQNVPAWIESINPADYMLLASDLSSPFQTDGEITAQAEAQELALATEKGSGAQKVQSFTTRQRIAISKEDCPTTSIDIAVEVFENPEIAASARPFAKDAEKGEKDWWDPSAISDARLGNGIGEANALFANVKWLVFVNNAGKWKEGAALQELHIRYKNIVAVFYPTMYTGASTTGFGDYSKGDTCSLTAQIARLWLDKVSRIEPPEQADLQIVPKNIFLTYYEDNTFLPLESAADKQQVVVRIDNIGETAAKNVYLQLHVLPSGEKDYQAIGDPVLIGDIPPGGKTTGTTIWDLKGENIEDAALLAQAFIPGENDSNEEDNSAAIKVNIYFAKNAERAYNPAQDGYSFENFNLTEIETEELVEGMLTTLISNLQPEQIEEISRAMQVRKAFSAGMATVTRTAGGLSGEQALLERTIFAPTYVLIDNYLNKMMNAGSGGHCYGMSATSALYFQNPDGKTINKPVSEMTRKEASPSISAHVRTWFLPLYAALQTDALSPKLNQGALAAHQALKSSLENDRKPLIIEFYGTKDGKSAGHAVLGYKMIEVEGDDPTVYVYDPNFPASAVKPPNPMPQIYFILNNKNWGNPTYMGYQWATPNGISAAEAHGEIAQEDTNALVPGLKKSISELAGVLHSLKKALIVVRCPADALFTDSQGRSIGIKDGRKVNEIPGAEVLASGEVEIYQLPQNESYQLIISGTDSGELDLDVITPENETGLGMVSFQNISISRGSSVTGKLQTGLGISSLQSGSTEISSTIEGSIDTGSTDMSSMSQEGKETGSATDDVKSGTLDPVEKAIKDLQDPDVDIRRKAATALLELNDTRAVGPLIESLNDPDAEVRANVASALGWLKDRKAVDSLIEKLSDEDPVVRSIVAISLGVINDSRAAEPLIQALVDENSSVRANAAISLGEHLRDSRALDPLINGLADSESKVRSSSAYALGELGDSKAASPLTEAQSDEDATVREEASAALEKLGKTESAVRNGSNKTQEATKSEKSGSVESELSPAGNAVSMFSAQKIDDQKGGTPSPDGTRIVYSRKTDSGEYYVIAGTESRINESVYKNVRDFVFSPNGEHYAYKALVGDKQVAVVDGSEGQKYDEIYKIIFSQDGRRYAYMANKGDQKVVVVDGKEEGPFESISGDPIVSSGGQHVLYAIAKEGTNYVVVDGEIQEQKGWGPIVSPDGSRWAYGRSAAYVGDPCYIVLDGKVIDLGKDNRISQMVFSPEGRRFSYDLVPGGDAYGNHVVVVDGVRGKEYPFPGVGKIVFSSDGSRTAYWAKSEAEGSMMVLDGVEGSIYDEVSDPVFSSDGSHVAYTAKDKEGKFVVLDEKDGPRYRDVWGLTFGMDGRLAYVAKDSREGEDVQFVVIDGHEERPYIYDWYGQGIRSGPVFSLGGKHVAYIANDGGKGEFVAIDDSQHLNLWTFLGGLSWGEGSPIIFDSDGVFHYIAENDTGTYLITAKIPDAISSSNH